jgi:hypothetical protein
VSRKVNEMKTRTVHQPTGTTLPFRNVALTGRFIHPLFNYSEKAEGLPQVTIDAFYKIVSGSEPTPLPGG